MNILYISIGKFYYKELLSQIVLLIINKDFIIDFHNIILFFSLAISLQIESDLKFQLDYKKIM